MPKVGYYELRLSPTKYAARNQNWLRNEKTCIT
jgi:hypothetical protein